jgi:hypothetical protein
MFKFNSVNGYILTDDYGFPLFLPDEYKNIVKFDIESLKSFCVANHIVDRTTWHIFNVGYWKDDGEYVAPLDYWYSVYMISKEDEEYEYEY